MHEQLHIEQLSALAKVYKLYCINTFLICKHHTCLCYKANMSTVFWHGSNVLIVFMKNRLIWGNTILCDQQSCHLHNNLNTHCIGNDKVTPIDFGEIPTTYGKLWKGTGLHLGLENSLLNNIETECSELRTRFEKILNAWISQDQGGATWGALEAAITKANRADLGLAPLPKLDTGKM